MKTRVARSASRTVHRTQSSELFTERHVHAHVGVTLIGTNYGNLVMNVVNGTPCVFWDGWSRLVKMDVVFTFER